MPTLHQVTVLSFTKVVGFRAADMELNWHLLKVTEFQFLWCVVTRTALLTLFYFRTFSVMIIVVLIFPCITEYTFISVRIPMLASRAATAWYDFILWELNSSGRITQDWLLPNVALSTFAILVAFAYHSSCIVFGISDERTGHVFRCARLPGNARSSTVRV